MSSDSCPAQGPGTVPLRASDRRRNGRGLFPSVLPLEERQLLSIGTTPTGIAPTAAEQYMLELINSVRANPAAAGQRLVALAKTDPVLKVATAGWDLNRFLQVISSYGPEPPLAFNTRLIAAATDQSDAMLAANTQFHAPAGYLTSTTVARASDGQAYYPTGSGWWASGENVFAYSRNVSASSDAGYVDYFEDAFLLDWGNPDFGHLTNLLAPGPSQWAAGASHAPYSEVGIGLLTGVNPTVPPGANNPVGTNQGLNVGPAIVSQEFAFTSGKVFLTGCFYSDNDGNGAYSIGEGLGGVVVRAVGRNGQGVFQTTTWASGGYSLQLPPGTYDVTATGPLPNALSKTVTIGRDNVGWEYGFSATQADEPVPGDYNGDGHTEVAVYRPATAQWFISGQPRPITFGTPGVDIPVPGDYDGVGHTELAVYQPTTGNWFVQEPNGTTRWLGFFGEPNVDIPVPGDYDGVGHTELAVYRPTTAQYFILSPGGWRAVSIGAARLDIPVPADYNGDGHTEPAVYRPITGNWYVQGPTGTRLLGTLGLANVDVPEPGDYDGVGHAELAVYRPSTGQYLILGPNGVRTVAIGRASVDAPIKGDFNGDGKVDPAVFRPSTAQWFAQLSSGGSLSQQFGQPGTSVPVGTWLSLYSTQPSPQLARTLITPQPQAETVAHLPPTTNTRRVTLREKPTSPARPRNVLLDWARREQSGHGQP